ncbi:hypothetical protein LCER1_G008140 [Lachnellula cervina]|uniref:Rhodopsin domain-containing protein n=1 Tax=Lachnellula cervina TaxID=1316786 RepID=A0A7D8UJC4_9HELO|nr:hypothetical protein LCER1_G008140 [Lachnellula cervina]
MSPIDNRADSVIAISAAMITILAFSILLRLYTRITIMKWIGLDDSLIMIAAVFALIEAITPMMATQYGLGKHYTEQKPEWIEPYTKITLASSLSYSASAMFIKLSLLSFYLRLLPNNNYSRSIVYAMITVSVVLGVGSILAAALQCIPIASLWNATIKGKCINVNLFYFANAAVNIITDAIIYCMPIPTLWRLQLPMIQRIGLCALLGLGGL